MTNDVRPLTRRVRRAALVLAALAVTGATPASLPTGDIAGTVRDQAGAPIANAQIFVVGRADHALSDSRGSYRLTGVPVGRYALRANFIGYKSRQIEQVPVDSGKTTALDFVLELTAVQLQEVTVATYGQEEASVTTGKSSAEFTGKLPTEPLVPRNDGRAAPAPVTQAPTTATPAVPAPAPVSPPASPAPSAAPQPAGGPTVVVVEGNTENYAALEESRWLPAAANPRSTFGIDVDAASYTNIRRFLTVGRMPPKDAVRIEELLNYFRYDYPEPRGGDRFSVTTDLAATPWAPEHRLVRIGIRGRSLRTEHMPPSNLVFLLDVSGSMMPPNKLPLVKQCFRLLVQQLRPQDRVAIVVYAGAAGLVLPSTSGADKATILAALDRLEAGGSTAGGEGLRLAYEIARENFDPHGNNRIILATDGDFNVGESSDAAMVRLIEERRDQGVFLTVLGFGTGNLKDSRMEQIADKGNGNYAYVDDLREGRRVFGRELTGTLVTIAKDVKVQVEFNPARVQAYRLIGYENRALRTEDFADDRKDAGELGAGHTVTALYEVVPVGASLAGAGDLDSLRYQQISLRASAGRSDEWLTVQLRYKEPTGTKSRLITRPVKVRGEPGEPTGDFRFAAAVAAFGLVLRDSEYRGTATLDQVLSLAQGNEGEDADGDRAEFVRLVESARALGGVPSDDIP